MLAPEAVGGAEAEGVPPGVADTVADGVGEGVADGAAVVGVAVATGMERRPEAVAATDAWADPPCGSTVVVPATAITQATAQTNAVRRRTR